MKDLTEERSRKHQCQDYSVILIFFTSITTICYSTTLVFDSSMTITLIVFLVFFGEVNGSIVEAFGMFCHG